MPQKESICIQVYLNDTPESLLHFSVSQLTYCSFFHLFNPSFDYRASYSCMYRVRNLVGVCARLFAMPPQLARTCSHTVLCEKDTQKIFTQQL